LKCNVLQYIITLVDLFFFDGVEAQYLTVYSGVWENDDAMKKEILPKLIVISLLSAGSAVN